MGMLIFHLWNPTAGAWLPDPQTPRFNGARVVGPKPSRQEHHPNELNCLRRRAWFYAQGLDLTLSRLEWIP